MRTSQRLLPLCVVLFLAKGPLSAQQTSLAPPPAVGTDGVYEIAASDLQKIAAPEMDLPRELSNYEVAETVTVAVTVSPEGRVKKAKAISRNRYNLVHAAEKTAKSWTFQPYLVNGRPVPVRTEISLKVDNTFNNYRDPTGDVPVHLDEASSRALLVKSATTQYPPNARAGRIQGSVVLRAVIGNDGHIHALHIIRGHPMLVPAAYVSVRQWEFKPYIQNGRAMPVDTNLTVNFTLQ